MARAAASASGFNELVEAEVVTGSCVKQTTATGETYLLNVATGEKVIPGSLRPDGTMRKPIKVRPGYIPVEERRTFRTRQQLSREEHRANVGSSIPGLLPVEEENSARSSSSSKQKKKKKAGAAAAKSPKLQQQQQQQQQQQDEEALAAQLQEKLTVGVDPSKRLRNLKKKLSEIAELEKKVAEGATATPEQLEKLGRKAALLAEVASLEEAVAAGHFLYSSSTWGPLVGIRGPPGISAALLRTDAFASGDLLGANQ
ncbi:hypothetical protein Efla_005107 [Eimeria flavescens]